MAKFSWLSSAIAAIHRLIDANTYGDACGHAGGIDDVVPWAPIAGGNSGAALIWLIKTEIKSRFYFHWLLNNAVG